MRHVIYFVLIIFNCFSISAQKIHGNTIIAELNSKKDIILYRQSELSKNWVKALQKAGLKNIEPENFKKLSVQKLGGHYYLVASNQNSENKSVIEIVNVNSFFYEILVKMGKNDLFGLSVSCNGCKKSCYPKIYKGKGYCSNSCSDCKKSETLIPKGIF